MDIDSEIEIVNYCCKYCDKQFTSKQTLDKHVINCVEKYKDEINKLNCKLDEKENKIKELDEKLVEAEQKLKTVRLEVENEFYKNLTLDSNSS